MHYKSLKEEQTNLPDNVLPNVEVNKTKQTKNSIWFVISSVVLLTASLFFAGYIYYLSDGHNLKDFIAFENFKVKIDNINSRPTVEIEFETKKFSMKHYLFNPDNTESAEKNDFYHKFKNYFQSRLIKPEKNEKKFYYQGEHDLKLEITKKSQTESYECYQVNATYNGNNDVSNKSFSCFPLSSNYWYGGHESQGQPSWPINNQSFDYKPYITGYPDKFASVLERYWLSSNGIAIYVDQNVPLHVAHTDPNQICLMSNRALAPYNNTPEAYTGNSLSYNLCFGSDSKTVHTYMINNYIGKPKSSPDPKMITSPVWTTWAYYFDKINQTKVADFAQQIVDHGYPRSNFEIDDKWEANYGDLNIDTIKFPDMKSLSVQLHNLGFRVCLWVHPFCNKDSQCFQNGAKNGYWVKLPNSDLPALNIWWTGGLAGVLDTTNPNASDYFLSKLNSLKENYLVDGFKIDGGESNWLGPAYQLYKKKATPNDYTSHYVRIAEKMGNFIEVRTAAHNQDVGLFYRIFDRNSNWSKDYDGLKSVISVTLQFGILGYPYVLPDIIYGNDGPDKSKKELFIRWTQLNAFLPAMQFSVPPWYFDNETDTICRKFVILHEKGLSSYIIDLTRQLDGLPIIRPMWWAEITDPAVFTINDQFMVGDEIVVAPVLDEGITSRDIFLPTGKWFDPSNNSTINGPTWLRNYPVVLETIPYFLLNNGQVRNAPYFQ